MEGQTILIVVIVALSILLLFVGVQVILIIFEIKRIIKKINIILEDAILGGGLIRPDKLTGVIELFRKSKKMESHGEPRKGV